MSNSDKIVEIHYVMPLFIRVLTLQRKYLVLQLVYYVRKISHNLYNSCFTHRQNKLNTLKLNVEPMYVFATISISYYQCEYVLVTVITYCRSDNMVQLVLLYMFYIFVAC